MGHYLYSMLWTAENECPERFSRADFDLALDLR